MASIIGRIVAKRVEKYAPVEGGALTGRAYLLLLSADDERFGAQVVVVPADKFEYFSVGEEVTIPGFSGSFNRWVMRKSEEVEESTQDSRF